MRSFVKIKPLRNGKITLSFIDIGKSCLSREFFTSLICLLMLFSKIKNSRENFLIYSIICKPRHNTVTKKRTIFCVILFFPFFFYHKVHYSSLKFTVPHKTKVPQFESLHNYPPTAVVSVFSLV